MSKLRLSMLLSSIFLAAALEPATGAPSSRMVDLLTEIHQAGQSLDDIWIGYRPSERSFAVYREGRDVVLLTPYEPPEGFLPLGEVVSESLGGRGWYLPEAPDNLRGSFRILFDFGDIKATAVRADHSVPLLIHEDFHGFQRQHFAGDGSRTLMPIEIDDIDMAELRALLELENRLLFAMLNADEAALREHSLDYLAIRLNREERLPEGFIIPERGIERAEGTARYVELRASERLRGDDGLLMSELSPRLSAELTVQPGLVTEQLVRQRVYITGAALASVLDRLDDSRAWQEAVAAGEGYMPELLLAQVNAEGRSLAERFESLRAGREFSRRVAQHRRLIARANRVPPIDLNRYPWILDFAFPFAPGVEGQGVSFSGSRIVNLDENRTLIADLNELNAALPGGRLRVTGHPVVLDHVPGADGQPAAIRIQVMIRRPPRSSGGRLEPGVHHLTGGEIRIRGIKLTAEEPVRVELYRLDD